MALLCSKFSAQLHCLVPTCTECFCASFVATIFSRKQHLQTIRPERVRLHCTFLSVASHLHLATAQRGEVYVSCVSGFSTECCNIFAHSTCKTRVDGPSKYLQQDTSKVEIDRRLYIHSRNAESRGLTHNRDYNGVLGPYANIRIVAVFYTYQRWRFRMPGERVVQIPFAVFSANPIKGEVHKE